MWCCSMIDEKLIHNVTADSLYIHDTFSSMFRGLLDWFQDGFDTRFNYKVISTYDKAVQFFTSKKQAKDGVVNTNILPSITLDPNLDFTNEERAGRFLWMFPKLDTLRGRVFANKVDLKEQGVTVSIMNARYSGTCDVTFWLSSIYELMDIRVKLLQYCGGTGRWIRPKFFWTHVIFPKELVNFKRSEDGQPLDWSATPMEIIQLATTNSKEYGVPFPLDAMWRLDSLSDGNTKYGADQLTEWKLTATFTWECNIPAFIRFDNYSFYDMHPTMHFGLGPTYSSQPLLNKVTTCGILPPRFILQKFMDHRNIYAVSDKKSPFVKCDSSQCDRFPEFYKDYDHIAKGRVYIYEDLYNMELEGSFPDNFIFLMDRYDPKFLTYLRKANGCISRVDDSKSEFYSLISSLNIPTMCHIDKKIYDYLLKLRDTDVTMDSISMCIYSGLLQTKLLSPSEVLDKDNYDVANNIFNYIQTNELFDNFKYKDLNLGEDMFVMRNRTDVIGKWDPKNPTYKLPVSILDKKTADKFKLYIGGKYLPRSDYELKQDTITVHDNIDRTPYDEVKCTIEGYTAVYNIGLAVNYHITKEDEKEFYTKSKMIEVDIPAGFDSSYIKCCSYNGLLDEHSDYEVIDNKIRFKLEPQRGKIIQIFMNRK